MSRMPPISTTDFRSCRGNSPTVSVMPGGSVNHFAAPAGPFALGTFRAGDREFAGLVSASGCIPSTMPPGLHRPSVRELLEHWAP